MTKQAEAKYIRQHLWLVGIFTVTILKLGDILLHTEIFFNSSVQYLDFNSFLFKKIKKKKVVIVIRPRKKNRIHANQKVCCQTIDGNTYFGPIINQRGEDSVIPIWSREEAFINFFSGRHRVKRRSRFD